MKKKFLLSAILAAAFTVTAQAQSIFDKIDNLASKVDRAANTADRAGKTGGKVISMFGKKKETSSSANAVEGETKTVISITDMNLEKLQKLNDVIEGTDGVVSTTMKYNSGKSSITVTHKGNTQEIMRKIGVRSKEIYSSQNITGMEDGLVVLKMK